MYKQYWNGIAENYETEIFSVFADDKEKLVTKNIRYFGVKSKVAIDLGCGIGAFLPFLSESFGTVHAVDFSKKCLQHARKNMENINGIQYWCEDMSLPVNYIPKADFILSVNSIISKSITVRSGIFKSIRDLLKTNGHLLLVVPSIESSLFSDYKLIEWNLKNGLRPCNAVQADFSDNNSNYIHQGIRDIGGTATKLYLKEELISIISSLGFEIHEISKIEYSWATEFSDSPGWMKDPYPWDWFLLAKKVT